MLEKKPDVWFDNWNESADFFIEVISWIKKEGLINIGQTAYLEYIVAIFLANPKSFNVKSFTTKIKKYAYYLSLSGIPFNKSNLDIVEKIFDISNNETRKINANNELNYSLNLSEKDILDITPSKSKFYAIINAFYIDKLNGKFTSDIMGNSLKSEDVGLLDKHHIFPKSKVSRYSTISIYNSIANYILLGNFDNREIFKDLTPKEYMTKLIGNTKFNCEQNLIDINLINTVDNELSAEHFIKTRAKNIANLLNKEFTSKNNQ